MASQRDVTGMDTHTIAFVFERGVSSLGHAHFLQNHKLKSICVDGRNYQGLSTRASLHLTHMKEPNGGLWFSLAPCDLFNLMATTLNLTQNLPTW
ncbi:hypothetical protein DPEC_G00042720 [Dallia pectoralis]|uniref:Uncharacterized protein n=1 Tax=Dallia pectoralis TaxID=75939 RepID=A0ACC2H8V9_DALPE|nr:hypothetical protein DPEC_G00042720 [Dallia pectoralis]